MPFSSDILGDEDHLGDMDFKAPELGDGIMQRPKWISCDGLSYEVWKKH